MEDSTDSPDDLMHSMREKIRSQAQRLRLLEQYKVLCETRIAEIVPDHPIPVLPEHINQPVHLDLDSELQHARSQIERLQKELYSSKLKGSVPLADNYTLPHPSTELSFAQLKELYTVLYFQHQKLVQDRKSLEDSLKAEIQASEEQRSYIEVLKQSIETNSYNGHEYKSPGKSFDEVQSLSKDERKSADSDKSFEERMKTDNYLREAAEALQFAEEEVMRLEDINKNQELEFEKVREKFEDNEKKLKQEISVIKENYKKALGDIDKATNLIQKLESQESEFKTNYEKSEKNFEELDQEYKNLESLHLNLEVKVRNLEEELVSSQSCAVMLKSKVSVFEEENSQIRKLNTSLEDKIEDLTDQNKDQESKYQIALNHINSLESSLKDLKNCNFELEIKSKMLTESQTMTEKNFKSLDQALSTLQSQNKDLKSKNSFLKAELKSIKNENSEFNLKINSMIDQILNQKNKISELEQLTEKKSDELRKLEKIWKNEIDQLRDNLEKLQLENEKLGKVSKDLETTAEKEKTIRVKLAEELGKSKKDCEELLNMKNTLNLTQKTQEDSLSALVNECNSLKTSKRDLLQELSTANQKLSLNQEENKTFKMQISNLSKFKSTHEEVYRVASLFCSSFGSTLLTSASFSPLISKSFKTVLQLNSQSITSDLKDLLEAFFSEFESITRLLSTTKENFSYQESQLDSKKIRLQEMTEQVNIKNQELQEIKLEIEDLKSEVQKKELEKEIIEAKLQYVSEEFESGKEIMKDLRIDYEKLQRQSNQASAKILKLKRIVEDEAGIRKKAEFEILNLQSEKNLLNKVLGRLEKLVDKDQLNATYENILRENLSSTIVRSSIVSPSHQAQTFSYDLYNRDPMMFE